MAKIILTEVGNLRNEITGVEAINSNFDRIEIAFENTLSRDGTSPNAMSASLDMNSNRIINLPAAAASTEPIRKGEFDTAVTNIQVGTLVLPLAVISGGTGASTAPTARINLAAAPTAVTSVSNPSGVAAQGQVIPTLQEDWIQSANAHWIRSNDTSIYPGRISIEGTWLNGEIAKVRITTGATNYDFTFDVVTGSTATTAIATALRNLMAASATLAAIPVYVQAVSGSIWDINFLFAQHPITLSNLSTTTSGTMTLTNPTNLLDGPVGLHLQRGLGTSRAPVANDNISGIHFLGPYGAGSNAVTYARIDSFITNPVLASSRGRLHFLTTVNNGVLQNRAILQEGLTLSNPSGSAPSGGALSDGDMGAGTINTPSDGGYYVNGAGFFRFGSVADAIQLIGTSSKIMQIGTNNTSVINIAANGTSVYPETTGITSLGQSAKGFSRTYYGGSTSGVVTVQPAAVAGTWTFTLPVNDGDAGQFLQTDGAGVTTWTVPSAAGLTVGTSTITGGATTRVLFDNAGVLGEYVISGTGNVAMTTSPSFTTPALGTPSAAVLTNATGLPLTTGVTGTLPVANGGTGITSFGTGVGTALGIAVNGSGAISLKTSPTFVTPVIGAATGASLALTGSSATIIAAGLNGTTNPAFTVDASTASQAAGFKITGAAAGGTVALVVTDSDSNTSLTINAKGTGTIVLGSVSTGAVQITPALTLSNALTYGGVTLANAVTGTGNMVLATAPTVSTLTTTGTIELGNASDTTIARVSAGLASIEGNTIVTTATNGKPHFFVSLSANQSVTSATITKVTLDTVSIDTGSYWDNTNRRYTPLIAGTYFFALGGGANASAFTAGNSAEFWLSKNGTVGAGGTIILKGEAYMPAVTANSTSVTGFAVVVMNGTTDFVELDARVTGTTPLVIGSSNIPTYLMGYRLST